MKQVIGGMLFAVIQSFCWLGWYPFAESGAGLHPILILILFAALNCILVFVLLRWFTNGEKRRLLRIGVPMSAAMIYMLSDIVLSSDALLVLFFTAIMMLITMPMAVTFSYSMQKLKEKEQ